MEKNTKELIDKQKLLKDIEIYVKKNEVAFGKNTEASLLACNIISIIGGAEIEEI